MNKVLIIGGTRFLGLEITRQLSLIKSMDVYVLNRGVTKSSLPEKVQRLTCDMNNVSDLISTVNSIKPDVLIDTVLSDAILAQLLPSLGGWLKRFIHTGSIGVYGNSRYLPAREEDVPNPAPYFRGKLAQDEVVLKYIKEYGLPATILRMSYIFGKGDVPIELWGGRNPEFFRRLQRNEEIMVPGDGKALLHPGHVSDLARSFILCIENDISIGKIYNIGGERSITLTNYLEIISKTIGVEHRVNWRLVDEALPVLVERGFANRNDLLFLMEHMSVDISRAKSELGYKPSISLEDGMKDNINWMREKGLIS